MILRLAAATLMLLSLSCTAAEPVPSLAGAWQLQSGEYLDAQGSMVDYASQTLAATKVLGDGHFAFTPISDGKFWAGGAGAYVADADSYTETPAMASYPLEGAGQYRFRYTLEGDIWTLERWDGERRVEREVWRRAR